MNTQEQKEIQPSETPTADDLSVLSVLMQDIKGLSNVSASPMDFEPADDAAS